jgi:serine/threonine protein kinase
MLDQSVLHLEGEKFLVFNGKSQDSYEISQKLVSSRSPIYLAQSNNSQCLAVKAHKYSDNMPSPFFLNESRYSFLRHHNVISLYSSIEKYVVAKSESRPEIVSLIFMELARCSLKDLLCSIKPDEKLARSLFHQIVDGISYLHANRVSHMDLKLENILLGSDFRLKLVDFDFAYKEDDLLLQGYGSMNFRAPEVISKQVESPKRADIYSLGVILYCLVLGHVPYIEHKYIQGYNLFELLLNDPEGYWNAVKIIQGAEVANKDLKNLIESMLKRDPSERASFEEIKKNAWYKKPVYNDKEIEMLLKDKLIVDLIEE